MGKQKTESSRPHFSVSQKKLWDSCRRKWFLQYICGIKPPDKTGALKFGQDFHTAIENVIKCDEQTIKDNKINRMLKKSLTFLRYRIDMWLDNKAIVEEEVRRQITDKTDFLGYIDLQLLYDDGSIFLEDHKTVGAWKYALTKPKLQADTQMNMYGYFKHQDTNDAIFLQHNQFNKKTEEAPKEVVVPYDINLGNTTFVDFIDTVVDVEEIRETADPQQFREVECNEGACNDYGGCPFYSVCHFGKDPFAKEGGGLTTLLSKKGKSMDAENSFFGKADEEEETEETVEEKPKKKKSALDFLKKKKKKKEESEETETEEEEKPKKKKPALKKKKKEESEETETEEEEKPKKKKATKKKEVAKAEVSHTTFAVGVVVNFPCLHFKEVLRPFVEKIEKEAKVSSIHLIEYSQGVKDLAYYKKDIMDACKDRFVVVDAYDPVQRTALSYLDLENCAIIRTVV